LARPRQQLWDSACGDSSCT